MTVKSQKFSELDMLDMKLLAVMLAGLQGLRYLGRLGDWVGRIEGLKVFFKYMLLMVNAFRL